MNTSLPHTAHRKRVYGLWIGDQLPFLAELSIRSYLHHGVEFCLFTYQDYDNLPEGALRMDANQVIDASLIYRHAGGSYAPFADWFRNKWLSENGGVWTDLDMLCLSSEELPDASQPWFALQEPGLAAVGIIAFPPHHPVIDTLLELSEDPANEAPWDDDATRQNKQHIREQLPDPATRRQLAAWGHAGPEGFTQVAQYYHELDRAAPPASIYPIHYTVWRHCYDGNVTQKSGYFKHSWAVHTWNEMLSKEPYRINDIHPQSIVGELLRELMPHALPTQQPPPEVLHPLSTLESRPDTKILVAICSCTKSPAAQRRDAVRRTWMSEQVDGVQCAFFVGRGEPLHEEHSIQLPSNDSYEHLPEKVLDFFDYALANLHFEWIFKCDDDTYLDLERLPELCELDCDFVGNPWLSSRGAPSGGAGYLLSRSLVERIVAHRNEIPLTGAEDILIGQLALSLCERAHASPRLNYGKYPFPLAINDLISAHWLAPSDLDWLHQHRRDKPSFRLWGMHPNWQDHLSFYPSGFFIREASGCTGRWEITTQDVLELHWDGWDAEALHPSPSGYQAGAFELHTEESLRSFYEQCIAIIPAKEHSLRCLKKNKRPFLQEPLFLHSVNYATQEGIRPIVSTDSAEIKDICLRYNIDYIDETVDDSDMSHCVAQVLEKIHCSYFAILQPTSPLRKKGLLRQMLLKSYAQRGSTVITTADHKLIGFIDEEFYVAYRDQDTATRFHYFDGSILTCGRDRFMETRQLFGEDVQPHPNEYPCTLQIDSEDEFTSLEAIARDPSFHKYLPPSRPKKICIIANKLDLQRDYSEFIDSCDIAIRINKMCNLKPGLTGSKIDIAFVSCWQGYHRYPRHLRESDRLKDIPLIYFHLPERPMVEQLIRDEGITNWSYLPASVESSTHACTSFTKTVALAATIYPHDELYILADTDVDTRTNHYGYHSHSTDNQILASLIDSGRLISITEDEISSHTSYSRPASIEKLRQQERQCLLLGADKSTFSSIQVAHKHWNDTLLLGTYYARRQGAYHIATILERSHNSITLEWEDYGVEHLRADENMVYRLQQHSMSETKLMQHISPTWDSTYERIIQLHGSGSTQTPQTLCIHGRTIISPVSKKRVADIVYHDHHSLLIKRPDLEAELYTQRDDGDYQRWSPPTFTQPQKVGILYICTGRYDMFWESFYEAAKKHLFLDHHVHYYVFTDSKSVQGGDDVTIIHKPFTPWPYELLHRYHTFIEHEHHFSDCDFVYFFNANCLPAAPIGNEVFPDASQKLIATLHYAFTTCQPSEYTYERHPDSQAYIPIHSGYGYIAGGFNGGRTRDFMQMAYQLREHIDADSERDIIALWHEESHFNRYLLDHPPLILTPQYLLPSSDQPYTEDIRHLYSPYLKTICRYKANIIDLNYLKQITEESPHLDQSL